MSANNYRLCPRCVRRAVAKQKEKRDRAEAAYGQVPAAEYCQLAAEADRDPTEKMPANFREDYQIATSERGVFFVRYHGECSLCDLAFSFSHQAKVLEEGE